MSYYLKQLCFDKILGKILINSGKSFVSYEHFLQHINERPVKLEDSDYIYLKIKYNQYIKNGMTYRKERNN